MKNSKTKWASSGPRTLKSELLSDENNNLVSDLITDTITEWDEAKHRQTSSAEVELFNSIAINECRACGSKLIKKYGKLRNGISRYRCKECNCTFTALTGTIFDSRKIPLSEWIEFLVKIYQYESLLSSSISNMNAYSTGKYWLKKIFAVLKASQDDVVLNGTVYIDETYFPVMPKDIIYDKDGKKLRGLSRNNHCVYTATNGKDAVLIANGKGKPSSKRILESLGKHIAPCSTIIDDGERSHGALVDSLNLGREIHKTKETKGLPNKSNPMESINKVHRYLKIFMRAHSSYNRDNIQDWLNLFRIIWISPDKRSYLLSFINEAINHREIIRYRDVFSKK